MHSKSDSPSRASVARDAFDRLMARLKNRRRLRQAALGLVITMAVGALSALLVIVWMNVGLFEPSRVDLGRYLLYAIAVVLIAAAVLWPLLRRVDAMQSALRAERQTPQLDGLLLSAVTVRDQLGTPAMQTHVSAELADDVLHRAVEADAAPRRLTVTDDRASLRLLIATTRAINCVRLDRSRRASLAATRHSPAGDTAGRPRCRYPV